MILMPVTTGEGRFLCFYFDIFLKWRVLTFYITSNGNVCEQYVILKTDTVM